MMSVTHLCLLLNLFNSHVFVYFQESNSSMPYILVRGNLASYSHKYPFRVLVSGLKPADIEQLNRFPCGGYSDESTIVYLQHPCIILSALEVNWHSIIITLRLIVTFYCSFIDSAILTDTTQ